MADGHSRATNLSGRDNDDYDIYVRDLRYDSTRLLSRGVRGHAPNPTIDGDFIAWSGRGDGSQDVFLEHLIDGEEL